MKRTLFTACVLGVAGFTLASPKIVYVALDGTGDGSSWANATDSLPDAYAIAADFASGGFDSGEVWIKTGRYTLETPIPLASHVTVRGGFAGTETDASNADPAANPVILNGDKRDDGYWMPENVSPAAAADRQPLWTGEGLLTYNPPNPNREDMRWTIARGASGYNYEYAFDGQSAFLEDCRFFGLTFTGFSRAAVRSGEWIAKNGNVAAHTNEDKFGKGFVFSNCRFLALGDNGGYAIQLFNTDASITDCTFDGNGNSIRIGTGLTPITNVIRRCTFSNGSGQQVDFYDTNAFNGWIIEDCDFYRNFGSGLIASVLYFEQTSNCSNEYFMVSNCRFRENIHTGATRGALIGAGGSYGGAWQQFLNCDFSDNISTNLTGSYGAVCVWGSSTTRRWFFRGCSFRNNAVKDYAADAGNVASVYGSATANNYAYFLDCTFTGNTVGIADGITAANAGTIVLNNPNTRLFAIGNTFKDNTVSGTVSGAKAELSLPGPGSNGAFTLVNSILCNESDDYVPMVLNAAIVPYLHTCYISKFDEETAGCGTFGRCDDIVTTGDPGLKDIKKGPYAAYAIGLSRTSQLTRAGSTVKISEWNTNASSYISAVEYTPGFIKNKPWKDLFYAWSTGFTDANAAAIGFTTDSPLMADAFGNARTEGRVALGPLTTPWKGFVLLFK